MKKLLILTLSFLSLYSSDSDNESSAPNQESASDSDYAPTQAERNRIKRQQSNHKHHHIKRVSRASHVNFTELSSSQIILQNALSKALTPASSSNPNWCSKCKMFLLNSKFAHTPELCNLRIVRERTLIDLKKQTEKAKSDEFIIKPTNTESKTKQKLITVKPEPAPSPNLRNISGTTVPCLIMTLQQPQTELPFEHLSGRNSPEHPIIIDDIDGFISKDQEDIPTQKHNTNFPESLNFDSGNNNEQQLALHQPFDDMTY